MQIAVWLVLLLGAVLSNAENLESGFRNLYCQQCALWCSGDMNEASLRGPAGPAGPRGRRGLAGSKGDKGDPGQPATVNMTALEELIERKIEEALNKRQGPTAMPPPQSSCRDVNTAAAKTLNDTGGVFDIVIPEVGTKEVYCNTDVDGGDWIVFQRRMDGSVDFYRVWSEYVSGFGNARGEYWLGLEALHQLTKGNDQELRVDMIAWNGTYLYAKYRYFSVGPASDNYRLRVRGYSGNATDSLYYGDEDRLDPKFSHDNKQFSTRDNDNDDASGSNCASYYTGAWWYASCFSSSLNGNYARRHDSNGVVWYDQKGTNTRVNMKFVEMKMRRKS